jgi:glycosyltransferase involved in cell wall biosynthesis
MSGAPDKYPATVTAGARRQHILVLNQYYWPGVEATANLLTDLCQALAADYDVTVITGRVQGRDDLPTDEVVNGVRVLRTRSAAYDRTKLHLRTINYVTYLADSFARALVRRKPDLVLCMTDPPIVGDLGVAVAWMKGAPLLVISEDVFPEIATELGRLTNPLLVRGLARLVSFYLRRADAIVAIGERMRERLVAKGAPAERVSVIANWVDTGAIVPQPRDNDWSREKGLADRFVVMHSGNVGHAQNLDALILATTYLRDLDGLAVPVIGFGARHLEMQELAARLEADLVRFLEYQPREMLSKSLSAAHIHYVGLARGLSGYVVPSRLYGILSAGRPVIVAADPDSETSRLVREVGCGVVVAPDRPDLVAAAIRDAYDGVLDLDAMGARGREYVVREADRLVALEHYGRLVAGLLDSSSGDGKPLLSSSERYSRSMSSTSRSTE